MTHDPRYFTTYYAIDAVNFKPVDLSSALRHDRGALPAAGRAGGRRPAARSVASPSRRTSSSAATGCSMRCNGGAEARRFNRLLIDAGLIKGL